MSAVSEIMSARKMVSEKQESNPSVLDVAKKMIGSKVGSVVIVDSNDRPIGIVTERDILRTASRSEKSLAVIRASEIMSSPVVSIRAFDSVESAASVMAQKKIKRLVVVEQDGSIAGVISMTDIARKLARILTDENRRYGSLRAAMEL